MNKPTQVTTNEVRISYEHLLQPYSQQQGAEPKYSCTLLIPKSDFAAKQRIDAAIQAAIQEGAGGKWGGTRPAQPPIPLHDGDGLRPAGEPFGDECKEHWVMTASSKQKQEIVDLNMNPIIDSTEVYSGMFARVQINFFAYNSNGKKGIGCGLGPVQKTRDGEPLGGRVSAAEAFGGTPQQQAYPAYAQQPQTPQYTPPQQPTYQTPAAPIQYQQPQYAPPAAPIQYQQPQYAPPAAQQYQQPAPQYAPAPPQIDPITGQPIVPVMGL